MPQATPAAVRAALWQRHHHGQPVAQIAQELQLPERTVRHLLCQLHDRGDAALQPHYGACGRRPPRGDLRLREQALQLRSQHPRWGAGRLRLQLGKLVPGRDLPCERTLQRWFRDHGHAPATAGRPPQPTDGRAQVVHATWQVDAAEQKRLASGQLISWLRVVDECSGAVLRTVVFPPGALQPGAAARGATAVAADLYGLGPAVLSARGQRRAVGVGE